MANSKECLIKNASVQHKYFISRGKFPIYNNGFAVRGISRVECQRITVATSGIYDAYLLSRKLTAQKAVVFGGNHIVGCSPVGPFRLCKYIVPMEYGGVDGWFSTGILVENLQRYTTVFYYGRDNGDIFRADPSTVGGNESIVGIIGRALGNYDAGRDSDQAQYANNCPYECDPVKAFGGPKLSRAEFALGFLVPFLAFVYLSDRALERRPFGTQHLIYWLLAVISGCFVILSLIPLVLRAVWPFI